MKDALRIPKGKTLRDFQRIGQCVICHNAIYGWTEAERRIYQGDRKLKNPCGFPRLRNKQLDLL